MSEPMSANEARDAFFLVLGYMVGAGWHVVSTATKDLLSTHHEAAVSKSGRALVLRITVCDVAHLGEVPMS